VLRSLERQDDLARSCRHPARIQRAAKSVSLEAFQEVSVFMQAYISHPRCQKVEMPETAQFRIVPIQ
jgi:hypothetical protein